MADITINKSIPYVRELTNSVLLDIPLFMSQHRLKMIEAVCLQSNKLYRLWMARNPGWKGRVHLIGHSVSKTTLGIADVLARISFGSSHPLESAYEDAGIICSAKAGDTQNEGSIHF